MDEEDLARLRDAFRAPDPPRPGDPPQWSAVLVPMVPTPVGHALLLTRRSENLRAHAGEISFPGGRVERGDAGPLGAALREAREETGLAPEDVEVLGHLTDYVTYRGTFVSAYVGLVAPDARLLAPTSPDEVAEILLVSVRALARPGPDAPLPTSPLGKTYPCLSYEGRELPDGARGGAVLHYWRLAPGTTVWGITGELLARFLRRAVAWEPPAPRRIARSAEFLP